MYKKLQRIQLIITDLAGGGMLELASFEAGNTFDMVGLWKEVDGCAFG